MKAFLFEFSFDILHTCRWNQTRY